MAWNMTYLETDANIDDKNAKQRRKTILLLQNMQILCVAGEEKAALSALNFWTKHFLELPLHDKSKAKQEQVHANSVHRIMRVIDAEADGQQGMFNKVAG